MALFGLFGKKGKANLTPDVDHLQQSQLALTPQLRDVFKRRVTEGQDLGFGPDYLDKATNPAIKASQQRFQQETVPFLSNQLSARGVARSAGGGLATDVLGKAAQQQQSEVDQLVSQFYHLNELQKKQDFGQALDLGSNLNQQEERMAEARAMASERLSGRTQEQANTNAAIDRQTGNQILQAAGGAVSGGLLGTMAPLFGSIPGFGKMLQGGMQGLDKVATSPNTKLNILGSADKNKLAQLLQLWEGLA